MSDERAHWIEIDVTTCSRRFGVGACGAALSARTPIKCVNTFKTCSFQSAFEPETVTLTLTMQGQVGLPIEGRHFACLVSVAESEQTVNIAGSDPRLYAMGRRAGITIKAHDLVYEDRFLDPYFDERLTGAALFSGVGYEPVGMFFQRLRARDPYFAGWPIRHYQGRVVDGVLIADRVTHYIMDEFDQSRGNVEFHGVDVLDLASNERALVPVPSRGRLLEALEIGATEFTLSPEGIGSEYDETGYVTVGNEIMRFTRAGDVLTVTRARFDTEERSHRASDAVQQSWRYTGPAYLAVDELFRKFAKVPPVWIPTAEWADEAQIWFSVDVDTIITKPMQVTKAVGELSILGFSLYTDLAAQRIRFRPNRFLFADERDAVPVITDDDIIGDLEYEGRDADRLTRVEFGSVQIDPTRDLADDNFAQNYMAIAGDAEDPRAYGDVRYRMQKTRWLNQGRGALVRILANRYLRRFKSPPIQVKVTVKRRKYGGLELTSHVALISRLIPSEFSLPEARIWQVKRRQDVNEGEISLTLQRFEYDGNFGFWAPNDAPDYGAATEAQKDRMAFWRADTGDTFPDGRKLYEWG
jgi:hypothetical protein